MHSMLAALAATLPLLVYSACAPAGALAEVEIIDINLGRPLPIHEYAGRSYVAGEPGHRYEIRIRNRTADRMLAVTSVDGVNVVTGETAAVDQPGYVLDRFSSVEIDGWRKSLDGVARFYFTTLPDSYAARTGRADEVGAIGIAVFRERQRPRRHCCDRIDAPRASADSSNEQASSVPLPESKLGTGHGEYQSSAAQYVDFRRASAAADETIVIYYDSRRNLLAQGIVVPHPPRSPRLPNPFPASFVPDPPPRRL